MVSALVNLQAGIVKPSGCSRGTLVYLGIKPDESLTRRDNERALLVGPNALCRLCRNGSHIDWLLLAGVSQLDGPASHAISSSAVSPAAKRDCLSGRHGEIHCVVHGVHRKYFRMRCGRSLELNVPAAGMRAASQGRGCTIRRTAERPPSRTGLESGVLDGFHSRYLRRL